MTAKRLPVAAQFALVLAAGMLASSCSSDDTGDDTAGRDPSTQQTDSRSSAESKPQPFTATPRFRLSRDTTYITGPVATTGYPDYVAAYNAVAGKGVTSRNNAAVPLLRAMGPKALPDEKSRRQQLDHLGLSDLPMDGPYLLKWWDFQKERVEGEANQESLEQEYERQYQLAMNGPWRSEEAPHIADWMEDNAKALEWAEEASRRERFFVPMILRSDKDYFAAPRQFPMTDVRDFARLLRCRSNLLLEAGDVDAAWSDLLTCYRLGRLYGRQGRLVAWLTGSALDAMATEGATQLSQQAKLSPERAKRYLADLAALPPLPPVSETFDLEQRFSLLDTTIGISRRTGDESGPSFGIRIPLLEALRDRELIIDYEETLRQINLFSDRMVRLSDRMPLHERLKAVGELGEELDATVEQWAASAPTVEEESPDEPTEPGAGAIEQALNKLKETLSSREATDQEEPPSEPDETAESADVEDDPASDLFADLLSPEAAERKRKRIVAQLKSLNTAQDRGRYVADHLIALVAASGVIVQVEVRAEANKELLRLALALGAYRTQHGKIPATLTQLTPDFLADVPLDPFAGRDFSYQTFGSDYMLRSAGPNGQFDEEDPEEPHVSGDDLVVRTYGSREAALAMIERRGGTFDAETKTVDLQDSGTESDDLQYLSGLPETEALNLEVTFVCDRGMIHLRALKNLKEINLGYSDLHDAGARTLATLTQLEKLDVGGTFITDDALESLGRLKNLKELQLSSTDIGDRGLSYLRSMKSLERLDLWETNVGDDGIAHLASLPKLRDLTLAHTYVTDAAVEHLAKMKNLTSLSINDTRITEDGVKRLKAALPRVFIFSG